jgi:hypothetical protein
MPVFTAKRTIVEATARDNGASLRVVVAADRIVEARPRGVAVLRGKGCDNMSFFSSRAAAEAWQKANRGESKLLTLTEAVARGARILKSDRGALSDRARSIGTGTSRAARCHRR